jgi:FkbM family methyltransferase
VLLGTRIKSLSRPIANRIGNFLQVVGQQLSNQRHQTVSAIWFDVGAHLGEITFPVALKNPSLLVYAFEPNLRIAAKLFGRLPNFIVIPMAVSENEGCMDFYVNRLTAASSLLPFDPEGFENWTGNEELQIEEKLSVPAIRLDSFMKYVAISQIDWLKIDAQGHDFSVVKSAGDNISMIRKITLEVCTTEIPLYSGSATKEEILEYMLKRNFKLTDSVSQSYGQEQNLTFVQRS